jgi:hypothetical protein
MIIFTTRGTAISERTDILIPHTVHCTFANRGLYAHAEHCSDKMEYK